MYMHRIDLSRVDINLLVVFEAIMSERHVGRAARKLSLSQSATSHALSRLRELLGDPLFVRHPKGVEPTTRAQTLAPLISTTLDSVREIVAPQAGFDPALLQGQFTIGATDYAVSVVIAPLIRRIQTSAPRLKLRIVSVDRENIVPGFDRGSLDFAIASFPDPPHRIEALPLLEEHFVGIARNGHPSLEGDTMSLEAFVDTPHALVSPRGDAHGLVDEALARVDHSRNVTLTVPHFLALPSIVAASDLVGALAERVARPVARSAGLTVFPLPFEVPSWAIHLLRPRQMCERPEVVWFSDLVRDGSRYI